MPWYLKIISLPPASKNISPETSKSKSPVLVTVPPTAVSVLFDKVSVPDSVAKSPSDNAVLNSAIVPVSVLFVRLIVLLVSVLVPVVNGVSVEPSPKVV